MNKLFSFFIILILLIQGVFSLGITPGRTNIDYSAGSFKEVIFKVINSEGKDMNLAVLIQGELAQSISVSEVYFSLSANEKEKEIKYNIELSPNLTPGLHTGEVVVVQLPEKSPVSQAFVGATVGVATQVHVFVPYPGKYAEGELNVVGPDNGEVHFIVPVINRGEFDLVEVGAIIDIYTSLNEKISSVKTSEVSIVSGERKELVATWKIDNALPGPYRAVATILYDEQSTTLEKSFNIGDRILEVIGAEVNNFILGEIAKFELLVENKWSEVISQAYAQVLIFNNAGQQIADFKSATYDLPSLSKSLVVAYWDTAGVLPGTYDSSIFLNYGSKVSEQKVKLDVSDREINFIGLGYVISSSEESTSNSLYIILVTIIVVLVLVNLIWFLVIRKKLSSKPRSK